MVIMMVMMMCCNCSETGLGENPFRAPRGDGEDESRRAAWGRRGGEPRAELQECRPPPAPLSRGCPRAPPKTGHQVPNWERARWAALSQKATGPLYCCHLPLPSERSRQPKQGWERAQPSGGMCWRAAVCHRCHQCHRCTPALCSIRYLAVSARSAACRCFSLSFRVPQHCTAPSPRSHFLAVMDAAAAQWRCTGPAGSRVNSACT